MQRMEKCYIKNRSNKSLKTISCVNDYLSNFTWDARAKAIIFNANVKHIYIVVPKINSDI